MYIYWVFGPCCGCCPYFRVSNLALRLYCVLLLPSYFILFILFYVFLPYLYPKHYYVLYKRISHYCIYKFICARTPYIFISIVFTYSFLLLSCLFSYYSVISCNIVTTVLSGGICSTFLVPVMLRFLSLCSVSQCTLCHRLYILLVRWWRE
jgi:hypothetical protein